MKTLHLTIATVDAPLFEGYVLQVTVPGSEGDMTILPEHTALISMLRPGNVVVVDTEQKVHEYRVHHVGTLEVSQSTATILL